MSNAASRAASVGLWALAALAASLAVFLLLRAVGAGSGDLLRLPTPVAASEALRPVDVGAQPPGSPAPPASAADGAGGGGGSAVATPATPDATTPTLASNRTAAPTGPTPAPARRTAPAAPGGAPTAPDNGAREAPPAEPKHARKANAKKAKLQAKHAKRARKAQEKQARRGERARRHARPKHAGGPAHGVGHGPPRVGAAKESQAQGHRPATSKKPPRLAHGGPGGQRKHQKKAKHAKRGRGH